VVSVSWVAIVLLSDNYCTWTAINLVWKHLQEIKRQPNATKAVQEKRYAKVVTLMVAHVCFDLLALVGFAVSKLTTSMEPFDQAAVSLFSSSMCAFHVGMFPVVYTAVRDLKFYNEIQKRFKTAKIKGSHEDTYEAQRTMAVPVI
jgi:hypothetical protein